MTSFVPPPLMLGSADDSSAFWAQPMQMVPQVAQMQQSSTTAAAENLAYSRDQVIDAARRHIEEVERAAMRAIAASKGDGATIEELVSASEREEQDKEKGDGENEEDERKSTNDEHKDAKLETSCLLSMQDAPRYHTMLCGIKSSDRNLPREEMENIFQFAIDYFALDAEDALRSMGMANSLDAVTDDDLWCFLMSHRIIGPLAKPDARIVRDAVEKAQSVDQLERIHDAVVGAPIDPRAPRTPEELAWIASIQKSVAAGAAYDCT